MKPQPLNRSTREAALERMAATSSEEPLDVLVIGGGVVGAATAFDAATRGLEVGLVEARDFGEGTSSRSSKLVHGGLRYLQMLDFKLVAEALRERDLLLTRNAPHLVRPLPFIFPFEKPVFERAFVGSGVSLYDALTLRPGAGRHRRRRAVPFHRHLSRHGLRQRFPGLDEERFVGALEYYDAQVDDARLVLTLARSAHSLGAHTAVRTEAVDYLRDGQDRICGARLRDHETGREFDVYARETILAAGVWTGEAQETALEGTGSRAGLKVLASKGIHITVPRDRIRAEGTVGVITQTEKSVLFLIPLRDVWAIGTTDTAWHEAVDSPAPTSEDIDYVLAHANEVLEADLSREDVLGTWAGLRPLLQPTETEEDGDGSAKVSREHTVMQLAPGLTGIAGGKLTTYRVMAEDAVDFASEGSFKDRESLTELMPLAGGQGYGEWADQAEDIAQAYGWDAGRVDRLLNRYGSMLGELLELIDEEESLGRPLEHAPGYLRAEVLYAVRFEGAMHLDDLLSRRTRLFHEVADRGLDSVEEILQIAASELGWDAERIVAERRAYAGYIEAQRAAEDTEHDAEAAALLSEARPVPQQHATEPSGSAAQPTGAAETEPQA
ncbi:glycerol-3-phosphate dehydrogenase/oxidase [Nesterenkonia cremea]|uniref:Glycerol-3-phosphate dehydrogenase n=1 Tax=Nesterenkonia cremea TaxID=1882340 RepID=A0A917EQ86_9MICC|nr:glycerol-3-phosphate dehydrogenase/oxidase [Nesterenkonia cremea]GGE72027.1 glycerol-3-phosphate dehydrogenase [Nesterenkonia cremea]